MTKTMLRTKPKIRAEQALIHWQRPRCTLGARRRRGAGSRPGEAGDPRGRRHGSRHPRRNGWLRGRVRNRRPLYASAVVVRSGGRAIRRPVDAGETPPCQEHGFSTARHVCRGARSVESLVLSAHRRRGAWSRWRRRAAPCPARSFCRGRRWAGYGTTLEQIDAGMNAGLSIGFATYDEPKMKPADGDDAGSFDKPDTLTFGRIGIIEVSLTATPMIKQAGAQG